MTVVPDSRPYPWPWSGSIDTDRVALLVTGWDDHWWSATTPDPRVLANIRRLTAAMPTLTIAHRAPGRRTDDQTLSGRPGLRCAVSLMAAGIDGFFGSSLASVLRERGATQLVLAGLGLETTVHSTLRRANDMGFECLVAADACAAVDPSLVAGALSSIEMSGGIFGAVGSTDGLMAVL